MGAYCNNQPHCILIHFSSHSYILCNYWLMLTANVPHWPASWIIPRAPLMWAGPAAGVRASVPLQGGVRSSAADARDPPARRLHLPGHGLRSSALRGVCSSSTSSPPSPSLSFYLTITLFHISISLSLSHPSLTLPHSLPLFLSLTFLLSSLFPFCHFVFPLIPSLAPSISLSSSYYVSLSPSLSIQYSPFQFLLNGMSDTQYCIAPFIYK